MEKTLEINRKSLAIGINDFLLLIKHRLTTLVVFTAGMGYLIGLKGEFNFLHFFATMLGIFLVVGSANGFNQILEADSDAVMSRTAGRPLPAGRMRFVDAVLISVLMLSLGLFVLVKFVNFLSALLAFIAFVIYVLIYTPMKKVTPLCTLVGAFPGAIPPMIGWSAIRGTLGIEAIILFGIQFLWQFPHFWSIALICKKDYERAGFKVLPSNNDRNTAINLAIYTFMLLPMAFLPALVGLAGKYATGAMLVGGIMFFLLSLSLVKDTSVQMAKRIMIAAEIYLPLVLIFLLIDKV